MALSLFSFKEYNNNYLFTDYLSSSFKPKLVSEFFSIAFSSSESHSSFFSTFRCYVGKPII